MIPNSNHKILLLGSGALKIGEAGEFDYSGSQAIKALKEEGRKVIVVNPNIATYQTSEGLADKVYFLPVDAYFVGKIIEKEKPDGILLSFGGQTALNCGLELYRQGKLKTQKLKNNLTIEQLNNKPIILGTPIEAIHKTEDRELFVKTLKEIDLLTPRSQAVKTIKDALKAAIKIGYPVIIRSAYSLGGQGSAFAKNEKELQEIAEMALSNALQILIEEDLTGWKEIEYEVVRDCAGNCITICNMENMDPMGVHTGESIVVAPSQTLTNEEYHGLRQIAIKLIRHLGVVGECNVQFALQACRAQNQKSKISPAKIFFKNSGGQESQKYKSKIKNIKNRQQFSNLAIEQWNNGTMKQWDIDYRIIEVNARLSRSSALASKATGYPLAFIAAKLALGYTLPELKNTVTQTTSAFFEPALDYVVVKIPRWDMDKFKQADRTIGSQMKSVGEVMAIGRNFEEALQKASRMLGLDQNGLIACYDRLKQKYPGILPELNNFAEMLHATSLQNKKLINLIKTPNEHRLLAITEGIKRGLTVEQIANWSKIDPWFIYKIKNITDLMMEISQAKKLTGEIILKAKNKGFSDKQIAVLSGKQENDIYKLRVKYKIAPKVNQIDTLAAEYPAKTNYLYLTFLQQI